MRPQTKLLVTFESDALPLGKTACRLQIDQIVTTFPRSLDSNFPEILFFETMDGKDSSYEQAQEFLHHRLLPKELLAGFWTDLSLLSRTATPHSFHLLAQRILREQDIQPDVTCLIRIQENVLPVGTLGFCLSLLRNEVPTAFLYLEGNHPLLNEFCEAFDYTAVGPESTACLITSGDETVAPDVTTVFLSPFI